MCLLGDESVNAILMQWRDCKPAATGWPSLSHLLSTAPVPPPVLLTAAGLGVRLVIVVGARMQINQVLQEHGAEPRYVSGFRVTDAVAMEAAIEAAGKARMEIEARLSKVRRGSSIPASRDLASGSPQESIPE